MTTTTLPTARQFRALGTYVHVASTVDSDGAARLTAAVLDEVDRACSRFRADSDLTRANERAGRWTRVSPVLAAAVSVAVAAARETDGLLDPCLGNRLVELGYDDDLAVVLARGDARLRAPAPPRPRAWREIGVDPAGAVLVPRGVRLDLGATAKAWASDVVAATVVDELGGQALVSLGGDLRLAGAPGVEPPRWPVQITEHPAGQGDPDPAEVVWLDAGGLATSSVEVRRWTAGGAVRHHLLDPRTGDPVTPTWRTVTATGPTCVAANVASTAAVVLGAEAEAWLTARHVDARLVAVDGTVRRLGRWPADGEIPEDGR